MVAALPKRSPPAGLLASAVVEPLRAPNPVAGGLLASARADDPKRFGLAASVVVEPNKVWDY